MNRRLALSLVTLLAALPVGVPVRRAVAQERHDTTNAFCFRARPLPKCRSFALTEIGYSAHLAGTSRDPFLGESRPRDVVMWELGAAWNVTDHSAVGATLFFAGLDADESRAGVRARYRYWLGSVMSLEVAAGLLLEANDVPLGVSNARTLRGWSGQVSFGFRDIIGVHARVDAAKGSSRTLVDWFAGVQTGSGIGKAGILALAAIALGGIIAVSQ